MAIRAGIPAARAIMTIAVANWTQYPFFVVRKAVMGSSPGAAGSSVSEYLNASLRRYLWMSRAVVR
jgi:hypothetical protein